jgi:elongation factor P
MQIQAIDLRAGYIISMDSKYCIVLEVNPVERGRGKSYVQVIYKTLDTGNKNNTRLATDEMVEKMSNSQKECVFLYQDGDKIEVMLDDTFEQMSLDIKLLSDDQRFLQEEMKLMLNCIEETEEIIAIDFKHSSVFRVNKRDSNYAIIGNGMPIKVPDFIKEGENIIVNIKDRKYLGKE